MACPSSLFLEHNFLQSLCWKNCLFVHESSPAFHPKRSAICPSEVCLRCPCRIFMFSHCEDQCAFAAFLLEKFQINKLALRPTSACRTMPLVHGHGKCMVNFNRYLYINARSKGPSSSVFSGTKSSVQTLQNHKIRTSGFCLSTAKSRILCVSQVRGVRFPQEGTCLIFRNEASRVGCQLGEWSSRHPKPPWNRQKNDSLLFSKHFGTCSVVESPFWLIEDAQESMAFHDYSVTGKKNQPAHHQELPHVLMCSVPSAMAYKQRLLQP